MRLSINRSDPGYLAYRRLGKRRNRVRIFVDGVEHKHVITADTKRAAITCFDLSEDGQPSINRRKGTIRMKRITGRVEIRMV